METKRSFEVGELAVARVHCADGRSRRPCRGRCDRRRVRCDLATCLRHRTNILSWCRRRANLDEPREPVVYWYRAALRPRLPAPQKTHGQQRGTERRYRDKNRWLRRTGANAISSIAHPLSHSIDSCRKPLRPRTRRLGAGQRSARLLGAVGGKQRHCPNVRICLPGVSQLLGPADRRNCNEFKQQARGGSGTWERVGKMP